MKFLIIVCIMASGYFLTSHYLNINEPNLDNEKITEKSMSLKKYLLTHQKPQRIEILNYSKKYENEIFEIKKMKIAQDNKSSFYVTIQFFTDESDEKAPLIAQIRFIDIKTENILKEESINLD